MKFLVVVPTIRHGLPGFAELKEHLRSTLTQPTDLHFLDGSAGKPATLNKAYDELLLGSDCDFYVTIDDDYWAGDGWQDALVAGFEALPEMGALGLWLGDDPEMRALMGAHLVAEEEERKGVRFRRIGPTHHLNGALIAFRREVAVAVGKLPASDIKYQIWEDAYRSRRVRIVGHEIAFVIGSTPRLVEFDDPPEYLAEKARDLAAGRKVAQEYLAKGGIRDPLTLQIRRILGGIKRRILPK